MKLNAAFPIAIIAALSIAGCNDRAEERTERVIADATVDVEVATPAPAASTIAIEPKNTKPITTDDTPVEPEADIDADLYVKRLVISHGVSGREPIDATTTFGKDDTNRVYAFVEVGNRDKVDSEIYVSFVKAGANDNSGVRLRVGAAPRWRTWAFTRLAKTPGTWHAIVKNGKGEELARQQFEITTPAEARPEPAV
jgi:hypothetical protein